MQFLRNCRASSRSSFTTCRLFDRGIRNKIIFKIACFGFNLITQRITDIINFRTKGFLKSREYYIQLQIRSLKNELLNNVYVN
jgi:hypothetical protein